MSLSRKAEKGVSWLKTVMFLWAAFVGFKILFAFGQANTTRVIAEALMMFIGAFLITGIPAFLLGWATGKNEPPIREAAADQGPMQRPAAWSCCTMLRESRVDEATIKSEKKVSSWKCGLEAMAPHWMDFDQ